MYITDNAQAWIKKAEEDLESAEILINAGKFNTACYNSHQSAEKYLKAFISSLGLDIPNTNDLSELTDLLEPYVDIPYEVQNSCGSLSQFEPTNEHPESDYTKEKANLSLRLSKEVQDYIVSLLYL